MELNTRFSPGQKVWAMYNNHPQEFLIEKVFAECSLDYETMKPKNMIHARYHLRIGLSAGARKECSDYELMHHFFLSKEDLIKSL